MDLFRSPPIPGATQAPHLLTFLNIWKSVGVVGLFWPGPGRLREWAYAGFFFDLTGAAFLHIAIGDWPGLGPSAGYLLLWAGSYVLRVHSPEVAAAA